MPQSEKEWIATERFSLETVSVGEYDLAVAGVEPVISVVDPTLTIMVGGIPRDVERQRNLPTINKLYAQLALNLSDEGHHSLLYNQPGTGKSSGVLSEVIFYDRIATLVDLAHTSCASLGVNRLNIIGTSAGAYIASRAAALVSEDIEVSSLLLQSPAAYPVEAEDLPYDERFTQVLRSGWELAESPVFSDITKQALKGSKLLLAFFQSDDPPIPVHIQEYYQGLFHDMALQDLNVTSFVYRGVAHNFNKLQQAKQHSRRNNVDDKSVQGAASILASAIMRQ